MYPFVGPQAISSLDRSGRRMDDLLMGREAKVCLDEVIRRWEYDRKVFEEERVVFSDWD